MSEIKLNSGQESAVKSLYEFLFSNDIAVILTGAPGTGKSFLINHLIKDIIPKFEEDSKLVGKLNPYYELETAATTNSAAANVSSSTNIFTPTVHSLFNLVLMDDYSTGKSVTIKNKRTWKVKKNTIFIIDEYTYINKDLYKLILESVDIDNCKIIFVGDKDQLNPVKENFCIVDTQGFKVIELTEPVRNSEFPPLVELCSQFRETVNTGIYKDIKLTKGVVDHLTYEEAGKEIDATFTDPKHGNKILAYTNDAVISYNDYIRDMKNLPNLYTAGEILLVNKPVEVTIDGEVRLMSGETEIEVISASSNVLTYVYKDKVTNSDITMDYYVIRCRLVKNGLEFNTKVPVDTTYHSNLIKHIASRKDWVDYFALKKEFADLRPSDSSTVHKSQGSTYNTVYIDVGDLTTCNFPKTLSRLFYVGISRARHRVVFFGDMPEKYGKFYNE